MQSRVEWRRVDGVLLFDKPLGLSSNAALQKVRRLYRAEKAGHTGTLDPLASGLLAICLGEATKFGGVLLESDKAYRAVLKLGERTETGDAEGIVVARKRVNVSASQLEDVLQRFRGESSQIPPLYSALKHQGQPLYRLARAGKTVERKPRRISIHKLCLVAFEDPFVTIDVSCSKGTYIRSLAEDIGTALGCEAHLCALQRTAIGPFPLDQARALTELDSWDEQSRDNALLPVDILVRSWPRTQLAAGLSSRFRMGQAVSGGIPSIGNEPAQAAVYDESGSFVGIGTIDRDGVLKPSRLLRSD